MNKKLLTIAVLIMMSVQFRAYATDSLSRFQLLAFPYINADVGVSYGVSAQYKVSKKILVNIGLRYLQSPILPKKINDEVLHHRFYSDDIFNSIGWTLGIKHAFNIKGGFVQPYVFYDITYFNLDTRAQILTDKSKINSGEPTPLVWKNYYNLNTLDNGLGIGGISKITGNLYLNVCFGLSANVIWNLPKNEYVNGLHINPALRYAIGLQYNF